MVVDSGVHDGVVVCGVEKMTDSVGERVTGALATAADAEYEVDQGANFVAINALLMKRYQHEFNVSHDAFAQFSVNAHRNAVHNPHAMFRSAISLERYLKAPMIAPPINVMDSSPICDGAAAVVLCASDIAARYTSKLLRVRASTSATDSLALHDRADMLHLSAVELSARQAYEQAGPGPGNTGLFELHHAFPVMSSLSPETTLFSPRAAGTPLALDGEIAPDRTIPIS